MTHHSIALTEGLVPDTNGCNGEQHLIVAGQLGILVIACLCLDLDIGRGVACAGMGNISIILQPMHTVSKESDNAVRTRAVPQGVLCGQVDCCRAYPALAQ